MNAISINKLSVKRGGKTVLREISFEMKQGEVFALLGGNGAGKSTTLLTLLGFVKPSTGSVKVLGYDISQDLKKILEKSHILIGNMVFQVVSRISGTVIGC